MSPEPESPLPSGALATIPDPLYVRRLIGTRYAEILVLKRLLRAAESRNRLFPTSPPESDSDKTPEVTGV